MEGCISFRKLHLPSIALLALIVFSPTIAGESDSDSLDEGYVKMYGISDVMDVNDEVHVRVDVTTGNDCDVYLLEKVEYDKLEDGRDFIAVITKEKIQHVNFSWTKKSSSTIYYLVIDNTDNAHSSDAEPDGILRFSMEYNIGKDSSFNLGGIGASCLVCIIGPLLIIICVAWVGVDARNRDANVALWVILSIILGPLGLIIWFFARPSDDYGSYSSAGLSRTSSSAYSPASSIGSNYVSPFQRSREGGYGASQATAAIPGSPPPTSAWPGSPGYPLPSPASAPPAPLPSPPAGPGAVTPTATVECPGCHAYMQVPRLGRKQVVECVQCGLSGEIVI